MSKINYHKICSSDTYHELITFMKELPDRANVNFSMNLIKLVENSTDSLRDKLYEILDDESLAEDENLSFAAFYALSTYCRRLKNFFELEQLTRNYGDRFDTEPLYHVTMSLLLNSKGNREDLLESIKYARFAADSLPNHCGALQNFADKVANALEQSMTLDQEIIKEASDAIDKAIRLNPKYAKYYCTRGRLLAFKSQFEKAKIEIQKAINIEDSNKMDYALRISDYQYYLLNVKSIESNILINNIVEQALEKILKTEANLNESMRDVRTKNLEFLAFFASILSFTIGSLQLANNKDFINAAALIVVLSGTLIVTYSSFRLLISSIRKTWFQSLLMTIIGIFLILLGYEIGLPNSMLLQLMT